MAHPGECAGPQLIEILGPPLAESSVATKRLPRAAGNREDG